MTYQDLQKANASIKTTDIKGKQYAEVNQRIKAFRQIYPDGFIETELLSISDGICIMQATVGFYIDETHRWVLGTGTAYEKESSSYINKTSFIENAETSAVGRALGMVGIGIDTSIASAEEVGNAIRQQETNTAKMTLEDAAELEQILKASGIDTQKLLKQNNAADFSSMTYQWRDDILQKLEKAKKQRGGDRA